MGSTPITCSKLFSSFNLDVVFNDVNSIKTFRAVSGSQFVYFTSNDTEPEGISNKVIIDEEFLGEGGTVDTSALISQSLASGSILLWEWNGQDATQFEDSAIVDNVSMSVNVAPELSPYENLLKVEFTNTSSNDSIWFVKSSSIILPDRFEVEMVVWDNNFSSTYYAGWAWGDATHNDGLHAYSFPLIGATSTPKVRFDAGVANTDSSIFSPTNPSLVQDGKGGTVLTVAEKYHDIGSSFPAFWVNCRGFEGLQAQDHDFVTKGQSTMYFSSSLGDPTGSWVSANMNRFGIALRGTSTATSSVEFGAIRIYKHLKDR